VFSQSNSKTLREIIREKCKINFCGWLNLQITLYGKKINLEVPVVDEIDKLLIEVNFRPIT
jgi:hypothetical protein